MSIDEMMSAITDLVNSDGAVEIPGLSLEPVVDNFIEVKYGRQLSEVEDEEERKTLREQWKNYYMKGDGKAIIEMEINSIKSNYSTAVDGLKTVAEATVTTTLSNAVPAVLTVGAATSTPNPAYFMIENKQKKNTLLSILKQISNCIVNLLISAVKIAFQVPDMIGTLIQTLITAKTAVNALPV